MERKIGEIFGFEGKKIKCVEDDGKIVCFDCIFFIKKTNTEEDNCENKNMLCISFERKDDKNVKFIEIKED